MADRYLTRAEIRELTAAYTLKRVLHTLHAERWPYSRGADGWPRILREYHDARMRGERATPEPELETEPNWSGA